MNSGAKEILLHMDLSHMSHATPIHLKNESFSIYLQSLPPYCM